MMTSVKIVVSVFNKDLNTDNTDATDSLGFRLLEYRVNKYEFA